MIHRKRFLLAFGFLATVFSVWLIARQINFDELIRTLLGASVAWIVAALLVFMGGYACRIERWRLMLKRDNERLKWHHCAGPLLVSFAANNVLPFRAGDVMRAFAFNRRLGVSSGVVVATLLVERLLDLLVVLTLFGVVLNLSGLDISRFAGVGGTALLAVAFGISLLLLAPQLFAPVLFTTGKLLARAAPNFGARLRDEIDNSLRTVLHLTQGRRMINLVAWSTAAWLAEGCVFWFAAVALPSINNPTAGWLALPVATLATLIPSTPGYVGTFDYFTVQSMNAWGNSLVAATAYALLVHVLLWVPPTLVGGLYLLLDPMTRQANQEQLH